MSISAMAAPEYCILYINFNVAEKSFFSHSAPSTVPSIREERASVTSSSSKEDILSSPSKEDLASDAEIREINKRERQKKNSVVHQFPS